LKECIAQGVIGHDWKKSGKYHFDEEDWDHIGVGEYGKMFSVKAHLTFLRYNVRHHPANGIFPNFYRVKN
jgi:hypothetical protein